MTRATPTLRRATTFAVCLFIALSSPAPARARSPMLVSTAWLARHARQPRTVIIHVARERGHYDAGHLPGACYLPWSDLVRERRGVTNELPPAADLVKAFERCGATNDSRIVLYGDSLGLAAARAWFTLDYLGLAADAALLDGGIEKWRAEKRPLSTSPEKHATGKLAPRLRPEAVIGVDAVRDASWIETNGAPGGLVLLDARPAAEYDRAHIPGAVNLYWKDSLTPAGTLRPLRELRRMFESAGLRPGAAVAAYCVSGVQASHAYFTLKYLGYRPFLFDGSYMEWSRAENTASH